MEISLIKNSKRVKCGLCWIEINEKEAVAIIKSLSSQIVAQSPNVDRLESFVDGDCAEMSICVIDFKNEK